MVVVDCVDVVDRVVGVDVVVGVVRVVRGVKWSFRYTIKATNTCSKSYTYKKIF